MYLRDPNAFAPVLGSNQYLLLGSSAEDNRRQIGKFSQHDAEVSRDDVGDSSEWFVVRVSITVEI